MKVTIEACRELISLPMYPQLTGEQIDYVAARVLEFVAGYGSGAGLRRLATSRSRERREQLLERLDLVSPLPTTARGSASDTPASNQASTPSRTSAAVPNSVTSASQRSLISSVIRSRSPRSIAFAIAAISSA
jgi:hypothetical protein